MSILIKGIEMPTKCCECLLAKLSPAGESLICNYMLSRVPWEERPFDCPLVPIPPHGRLIDADEITTVSEMVNGEWKTYVEVFEVADAPTIIEAEPPKEET